MPILEPLVEQAIGSELFTSPRIEADLTRFLDESRASLRRLADRAHEVDAVPLPVRGAVRQPRRSRAMS